MHSLLANTGFFYSGTLPFFFLCLFSLLLIPSFLRGNGDVAAIAKAVYCYLLQSVGIFLMSLGALPTLSAVLGRLALPASTYLALLILFTTGGLLYLWHDFFAEHLDEQARRVPFTLYFYTFKLLGMITFAIAALSLLLTPLLQSTYEHRNWWVLPFTLLTYGLLILWVTQESSPTPSPSSLLSSPKTRRAKNIRK